MTVKDLIIHLLDCANLDGEVFICDDVEFENENGKMAGSVYEILSVEPDDTNVFLNFNNRNHKLKR